MPEATFTDLQRAISGFNDEMKSYAIQSAVNNASQNVRQLQQAQLDDNEKFNQTKQLSDQLALQLTGLGASGVQIEGALRATQPQTYQTPESMFSQALVSGNENLRKKAHEFKDFADKNKFEMAKLKMQQSMLAQSGKAELMQSREFNKLVPKVQEQYNRSIKDYQTKVGQIESILSLPASSIKDRLELTTLVKSIGQDVGNIGEKEAEQALGTTAIGDFKRLKNYMSGAAASVRTPEQAYEVLKVFNQSKNMLNKLMDVRANKYAYQLTKASSLYGTKLNLQEAKDLLVMPSYDESQQSVVPQSSAPNTSTTPSVQQFNVSPFLRDL
jgi:hypothetical protein